MKKLIHETLHVVTYKFLKSHDLDKNKHFELWNILERHMVSSEHQAYEMHKDIAIENINNQNTKFLKI